MVSSHTNINQAMKLLIKSVELKKETALWNVIYFI